MKSFDGIACVSIAVSSIQQILPAYTEGLGLQVTAEPQESKRGFGMRWVELGSGGKTFLELLEPTGTEGPVAKFLSKPRVSSVYQLRFAVDDLDECLATLETRGMRVLKGADVPGQPRVGWVHPSSTGGALIELVQFE